MDQLQKQNRSAYYLDSVFYDRLTMDNNQKHEINKFEGKEESDSDKQEDDADLTQEHLSEKDRRPTGLGEEMPPANPEPMSE